MTMIDKADAPYPYLSINGEFLSKEFLDDVWMELQFKAILWQAGLDKPSFADSFAYKVLTQITMRKPEL